MVTVWKVADDEPHLSLEHQLAVHVGPPLIMKTVGRYIDR